VATIERPGPDEYAPYYGTYVGNVGSGDVLETLEAELATTLDLLGGVSAEQEGYRYEPDKWSVREVIAHLVDTERLFSYRALSFARGDGGPLPGMDQDEWVSAGGDTATLADLADEMAYVRGATITLFRRLDQAALARRGIASGVEFTVRAFPFIIAGHGAHHRKLLVERYGLERAR
jgi:hypothetical protein